MKNNKLKAARTAKGWTQDELCKQVGVACPYPLISYIESGKVMPTLELATKIAEVLEVRAEDIWPDLFNPQKQDEQN